MFFYSIIICSVGHAVATVSSIYGLADITGHKIWEYFITYYTLIIALILVLLENAS